MEAAYKSRRNSVIYYHGFSAYFFASAHVDHITTETGSGQG
jgi:hypothetical protein